VDQSPSGLVEQHTEASAGAGPRDQPYDGGVRTATEDTWLGLVDDVLPVAAAYEWAIRPDCGAVVLFSGTARDHSPGREGVEVLEYEAYDEQVVPRLSAIADDARIRWSSIRRIALIHRTGVVPVGESAVIAVVSAPHRDEAFAAARFCIDALKATVPIWKREEWSGGASWGLEPQHITEVDRLGGATG
jgi:molybdopterin synthase catalytic subunit